MGNGGIERCCAFATEVGGGFPLAPQSSRRDFRGWDEALANVGLDRCAQNADQGCRATVQPVERGCKNLRALIPWIQNCPAFRKSRIEISGDDNLAWIYEEARAHL